MKILDLIFAARPLLHLPIWSVYLISMHQLGSPHLLYENVLMMLAINFNAAAAYYINQVYDYDSDLINNKLGFLQKDIFTSKQLKVAALVCFIVSIVLSLIICIPAGLLNILLVLTGLAYSMPPVRLKDRPVSGLLVNGISFGFIIPLIVGYVNNNPVSIIWTGVYFSLAVMAIHLLTIIPDRNGDLETGKITLAKYMSDKALMVLSAVFIAVSILASLLMINFAIVIISIITLTVILSALFTRRNDIILFACKFPILILSILASYYFPIYFIFLIVLLISTRLYYRRRFNINYPRIN